MRLFCRVAAILLTPLAWGGADDLSVKAAEGDLEAVYSLGLLYATGEGVEQDRGKARQLLLQIGEKDGRAANALGLLFDPNWYGDKGDTDQARYWYRRAQALGHASAGINLAALSPALSPVAAASKEVVPGPKLAPGFPAPVWDVSPGEPLSGTQVIARSAPGIAEMQGEANYGSGVVLGQIDRLGGGAIGTVRFRLPMAKPAPRKPPDPLWLVVTNKHVLEGNTSLSLGLGASPLGQSLTKVPVVGTCVPREDIDIAFVLVGVREAGAEVKAVDVDTSGKVLPPGSPVFVVANPQGYARSISAGLMSPPRPEGLQYSASISHGSSGGGLFGGRGQLVGIVLGFSSGKDSQNLNLAVPVPEVLRLLREAKLDCLRS